MKLVELLARELVEWPEQAEYIVQEGDEELYQAWGDTPVYSGHHSWRDGDDGDGAYFNPPIHLDLSDDWKSAVLTRADWEAERARIKGEKAMPKPNKDGWIRHRGGKCPVESGETVEVRYRDGAVEVIDTQFEFAWAHDGAIDDIMAWRPHKPEQVTAEQSLDVEMPAAKYFDGPIQWRDRIREIDAASKEEEARHCAAMDAYDEERTSLVAKLKAEGFVLIQNDEPNSAAESAQDDIAQQDMSDPANWRVGDQVEIVESSNPGWKQYKGMTGNLQNDGDWFIDFDSGDWYVSDNTEVKWHSRPTK